MKTLWSCCVVLVVVLSGCFGDNAGPETLDEQRWLPSLADLTCDFTYPDNSTPVACVSAFDVTSVSAQERPGFLDSQWLCVHQSEASVVHRVPYTIHWQPIEGKHGIFYSVPPDLMDEGVIVGGLVWTLDGSQRIAWQGTGATGFVELPLLLDDHRTQQIIVHLYTQGYTSPTPALADGTIETVWSLFDDKPYPIQVVTTESGTYYFDNVTARTDPHMPYLVQAFDLQGEDFEIRVDGRSLLLAQDGFTNGPLYQCTL